MKGCEELNGLWDVKYGENDKGTRGIWLPKKAKCIVDPTFLYGCLQSWFNKQA